MSAITFIDEVDISNKRVLLRVDFNVSMNPDGTIADDIRERQAIPTIKYLLEKGNTLFIVSHLGNPKEKDEKFSLKPVSDRLQLLLPDYKVEFVKNFVSGIDSTTNKIFLLDNIRFYPEEKANDQEFAKKLASLAEVYVEDAFGVCHRSDASIVSVPKFLPSYGGLLLKKEIMMIDRAINNPKKPVSAILGGAKVSTKIGLVERLLEIADHILIGGAMANTFLKAKGQDIGASLFESEFVNLAANLLADAGDKIIIPVDWLTETGKMLDIGPNTEKIFSDIISQSRTIIWNGPMGYFENPAFAHGTEAIFQAIIKNTEGVSVVGGGDTLTAIMGKPGADMITHLSTGGGAMLEYIEKGTLPGIEALAKK